MGCSGSKQGSIGAYEQCSCSENRKVNICPVHILNCMDNVVEDYKQDDLNNERKIYERKIIAKKRDGIGAIKTTSNVRKGRPPLSPYIKAKKSKLKRNESNSSFKSSTSSSLRKYSTEKSSIVDEQTPQLSSDKNHQTSLRISPSKIKAYKTTSASSMQSLRSTSSLSSNTNTNNSHPNTPRSGNFGLNGTAFEIGVYSKSSGKLKRIIS